MANIQNQILQAKEMINQAQKFRDPKAAIIQMMQSNPQLKDAFEVLNACGDPQKAFYELAKRKGVDPNWVLNSCNKAVG